MHEQFMSTAIAIFDEPELSELTHEKVHPLPGCAYHLRQGFLTQSGNNSLEFALFADPSQ